MSQVTDSRTVYSMESASAAAAVGSGVTSVPSPVTQIPVTGSDRPTKDIMPANLTAISTSAPPYFQHALEDAERLLKYAAEAGIDIDSGTRDYVLQARASSGGQPSKEVIANLLAALTKLAQQLKPITAESLKACANKTQATIRTYWIVAVCLATVIVPFSVASFVTSAISNAIRADITAANDLAVKLRAELGTKLAPSAGTPETPKLPTGLNEADVISQLQLYASTIRAIDARSLQLNWFVLRAARDPFAEWRWKSKPAANETKDELQKLNVNNQKILKGMFQLPVGLPNMPETLDTLTTTYQDVRLFGQDILDLISVYYGAITICLLPVLYALLGTCAYLLRSFDQQMALRSFLPSRANSARFLIAAIGGAVVGLFNNFTVTQGASIPPLALAFLVGYAVDVFFSFLEGLLQVFTKNKSGPSSPQPLPSTR